ncbi:MAG: tRNA glutamyl-Q(34) synthetase GluQRS [Nevskiaceae bacterium]|nr:MAG: tRNA glutamyl-Q(34) synthetase GluQRS [Nevskiaceae bacterium]
MSYRGRFAPTPSGPLHLGSLLTALASFLQARAQGGRWLLRIDDLDRPRCVQGADAQICAQLEAHGLLWDEAPRYQTQHIAAYTAALEQLRQQDRLYGCTCTRAQLAERIPTGPDGPVYDGHCRHLARSLHPMALRLRVDPGAMTFLDGWQGPQQRHRAEEMGDFVVQRADGQIAYQLACAVDEPAQGITEVVRGADLLGSTFQQLCLQDLLGLPRASYRHLPVLTDRSGQKLSKQNHAAAVDAAQANANLVRCLRWLGQNPPRDLERDSVPRILEWAIAHWRAVLVPGAPSLAVE